MSSEFKYIYNFVYKYVLSCIIIRVFIVKVLLIEKCFRAHFDSLQLIVYILIIMLVIKLSNPLFIIINTYAIILGDEYITKIHINVVTNTTE